MQSLSPELALYGSKNKFTRTKTVLPPISEVSTGAVSLIVSEIMTVICFLGKRKGGCFKCKPH